MHWMCHGSLVADPLGLPGVSCSFCERSPAHAKTLRVTAALCAKSNQGQVEVYLRLVFGHFRRKAKALQK